jgi:disulfide oxidoreductase YuzD
MHTFNDDKNIYSVDMMFAYINIFKPKSSTMHVEDLLHNLEFKCWGYPDRNIEYSPFEVIDNPNKYKDEIDRITNANLNYPIIVYNNNIVDGVHRLTKAELLRKKSIKVFIFDDSLMKYFLIGKRKDRAKVDQIKLWDLIALFYSRFEGFDE